MFHIFGRLAFVASVVSAMGATAVQACPNQKAPISPNNLVADQK